MKILVNNEILFYKEKLKKNIRLLFESDKLAEAKELLNQLENIVKDDVEIYSIKGVIAMTEGDMIKAEEVFKEGLSLDADYFDLNYNMGFICQSKGEERRAIEYYKKALLNAENKSDADDVIGVLKALVNEDYEKELEESLYKKSKWIQELQVDDNVTIINTDDMTTPSAGSDLYSNRENIYNNFMVKGAKRATIVIQGYNRLEKTKYCVECVLKYTRKIDYELILIDNGSSDGTFEYFKTVEYKDKKVIRVTNNLGSVFPILKYGYDKFNGKYIIIIPNDAYVTTNWLSNLLRCLETDNKIGWVMPMSSNVSNLQDPGLVFNSLEEMQQKAKAFNKSDPSKWENRLRLVNVLTIYKREILDLVGKGDVGFFHEFGEDDYCMRIRRMGYKFILCGDTFVHHDHDFSNLEGKDPSIYEHSIDIGRNNFKEKYYGIDAWDDVINFERSLINLLPKPDKNNEKIQILGLDIRCGTPILEIENFLRKNNLKNSLSCAFTTHAKYYLDLKTICKGEVNCDRIEFLHEYLIDNSFDYIVIGEPINKYIHPLRVLDTILKAAKKGSKLLLKLVNSNDINKFLEVFGSKTLSSIEMYTPITLENVIEHLKSRKVKDIKITSEMYNVDENSIIKLKETINTSQLTTSNENVLQTILTKEYLLCVTKY